MVNETSRDLLRIALDRGYLEPQAVKAIAQEARIRRVSPERILLEKRILSVRRLERLRSHLRYEVVRKADRLYAAVALKCGVSRTAIEDALRYQKKLFRAERRSIKIGSRLIERGFVSIEGDREIRAKARSCEARAAVKAAPNPSSTQALPLDEESALRSNPVGQASPTSYAQIEAALARVEAIRSLRDDLSTSDKTHLQECASPDSAQEMENAYTMLARQRARSLAPPTEAKAAPAPRRKKRSALHKIFNRGAA